MSKPRIPKAKISSVTSAKARPVFHRVNLPISINYKSCPTYTPPSPSAVFSSRDDLLVT